MKYNPRLCEEVSQWEGFSQIHPHQDPSTIQGTLKILYDLERMLCDISGMDAFTLQPSAGAQGELTGLLIARAYHASRHDDARTEIILPNTSHGTNPATASMAGYSVVEIPSTQEGTVDLDALTHAVSDTTACFMLTNPNTLGIFESDIKEIANIVHKQGALLYYDGANMNAILGKARPGDMGFDIVHLNLHKTFSTPHGGGGPGSGPVGVKKRLEAFLPVPRVVKTAQTYGLSTAFPQSVGKVRSWHGNVSALLKAYTYIMLMGADGLANVAEIAVLNANYMKQKLLETGAFELPYRPLRKHEFVLSCEGLLATRGIRALDVAKRLLDFGLHPPTVYFPLLVKEALMIEPTETETKRDLDAYIEALATIAQEDPEVCKAAPHRTTVRRIDEVGAVKHPVLTWQAREKAT
jgi:glycine dehydrogenase subunit 2